MGDKDLLEAPYRKLQATEEKIEEDNLLSRYRELYMKKFHDLPILPATYVVTTMVKDFKRLTKERAMPLLEHYFTMKGDWEFEKEAFSLQCLLKNYHRIAADLSKRQPKDNSNRKIAHRIACDSCWKDMVVVGDGFALDKDIIRCEECELLDAPVKKTIRTIRPIIKDIE